MDIDKILQTLFMLMRDKKEYFMNNFEKKIIDQMNILLEKNAINEKFFLNQNIYFTSKTVIIRADSNMHTILENHVYQSVNEMVVYHYTSDKAAKNIRTTGLFRFYSILKRYRDGELKPFLHKFGFDNAFDKTVQLKYRLDYENETKDIQYFSDLDYKNIFYASFVEASENETKEMQYFSDLCETRLKFLIKSTKGFFRKINYHNDSKYNLLLELRNIANRDTRKFIVEGMASRFASFCISEDYIIENEYRAYWRHWSEKDGFIVNKDEKNDRYINIPLGEKIFRGLKSNYWIKT